MIMKDNLMKTRDRVRKIKLLFMIDYIGVITAGTENQLLKILNNLDAEKYDINLVCLKETNWILKNKEIINARVKIFNYDVFNHKSLGNLNEIFQIYKYIKDLKPDIVITLFKTSVILGVFLSHLSGARRIAASRRDYGDGLGFNELLLLRFSNHFLKVIITNSTPVKKLTIKNEKFAREKIVVIHNGIEINEKPEKLKNVISIKSQLKIPADKKMVGIVANLREMKRHITLIRAAAEVVKTEANVCFVLVGDGPLRLYLEEMVRFYEVQDYIYFAGSQTDILPYLKMFDIGVNCSAKEGMSNAIMEYMIYGIPSIVSYAGGNPELIENGINGFTFKLDRYNELAEKILLLLNDDELQTKFMNESLNKIQSKFSIENMINSYDNLFKKLVYDC